MEAFIKAQINTYWFHKITEAVTISLENRIFSCENDSAKKLNFSTFVLLLLYYYLQGFDSLRSLITDLKTNENIPKIGLFLVGLTTIHDAFHRYSTLLFQQIYLYLLKSFPLFCLEEFNQLGRFILNDGSVFPVAINQFWAEFKANARALKLHLLFELNQMIPCYFLVTDAKKDERKVLSQLIEKATTYIADRGYLSFDLFSHIISQQAFLIIRSRHNLKYQVIKQLPVQLIDSVKYIFFQVTDELVYFDADDYHQLYRRISFRTNNTIFVLITNRLDLTTYQVIRLYAFRWQIELFFRYFKRIMKAIHLINTSQNGVTIQFYAILIVNLLLIRFKQQQMQKCLFENQHKSINLTENKSISAEDFIRIINKQIPNYFKISKQEMNAIRNSLFKPIQLNFDFL